MLKQKSFANHGDPAIKKRGGAVVYEFTVVPCDSIFHCRLPQSSASRYVWIIMPRFLNGNSMIGFVQSDLGKIDSHNPKIRLFNSYNLCISNVFDRLLLLLVGKS